MNRIQLRNLWVTEAMEWKNQFERVENVHITCNSNCDMLRLNHSFPLMQKLEFQWSAPSNSSFIEHHYPHLKHLNFLDTDFSRNRAHFEMVLRLNPQLLSFHVNELVDAEFLQFVEQELPNLKVLSLSGFPIDFHDNQHEKIVRFTTVKELSIDLYRNYATFQHIPLIFDGLEKIELFSRQILYKHIEFILQHKELKEIHIPWYALSYEHLMRFVRELPHLVEITTEWNPRVDGNGIIGLISRNDTNLQRITIFPNQRENLLSNIPDDWHVEGDEGNQLTLIHQT